jgi:predicted dehydrogenase
VSRVFGIQAVFADHREMLKQVEPEGVVIAVPHVFHYALARDALNAGAHVMVEKPMTLTSREAWELVRLSRERGRHLTVGYPWNYTSHARTVRTLIQTGQIGTIQLVTGLFASVAIEFYRGNPAAYRQSFKFHVTGPRPETYADPAISGGGQGHLQVTHLAGLILWETDLRPEKVFAMMAKFDVPVDLVDAICVRFAGGAVGSLDSTGNIAPEQRKHVEIRIFGTLATIVQDPMVGTLSVHRVDGLEQIYPQLPAEAIYPAEATARNLADLVLGENETCAPAVTGARTVDLLDAAYRSATSGAPADVPDPGTA